MTADRDRTASRRLHWDGTVTAGNVLTAATMVLALVVWGLRLEGRVDRTEERQRAFEALSTQSRIEDRASNAQTVADIRAGIRRIEDILLRGTSPQSGRGPQ
ncbi:MAG TPA: hypothetical protein VGN96_00240 [Roseococcus sp.]|nr:hypothetical protein [Roseococcus sp.]